MINIDHEFLARWTRPKEIFLTWSSEQSDKIFDEVTEQIEYLQTIYFTPAR